MVKGCFGYVLGMLRYWRDVVHKILNILGQELSLNVFLCKCNEENNSIYIFHYKYIFKLLIFNSYVVFKMGFAIVSECLLFSANCKSRYMSGALTVYIARHPVCVHWPPDFALVQQLHGRR